MKALITILTLAATLMSANSYASDGFCMKEFANSMNRYSNKGNFYTQSHQSPPSRIGNSNSQSAPVQSDN